MRSKALTRSNTITFYIFIICYFIKKVNRKNMGFYIVEFDMLQQTVLYLEIFDKKFYF